MYVVCLDFESILVPEIWISVAEKKNVPELSLTTRDIPDYDALMKKRLEILKEHDISLDEIQEVIGNMEPLEGAVEFLNWLRQRCQVIILSGSFYEFVAPLMKKMGNPTIFCNWLVVDNNSSINNYVMRQSSGKMEAVKSLKSLGFKVIAVGDSYNDADMLEAADVGILFNASDNMKEEFPQFSSADDYQELKAVIKKYI
ncbi:MAG: bifunctional phosphoserine phosphatase/homoserine phosphotransferase ThrH [Candidatus Aenigmatarchaeota archaeon]